MANLEAGIPQLSTVEQLIEGTRAALPEFPQEAIPQYQDLLQAIREKAPAQTVSIVTFHEWGKDMLPVLDIKLWRTRVPETDEESTDFEYVTNKYCEMISAVDGHLDSDFNLYHIDNPESLSRDHVLAELGTNTGRKPRGESVKVIELGKIR